MVPENRPAGGPVWLPVAGASVDLAAKRDRTVGLSILAGAFLLALLGNWWVKVTVHAEPEQLGESPPDKTGLLGFPQRFDPLSALERARDRSVRGQWLFGIALKGVRANGTLDFDHGATAQFVFGSRRGDGPQAPVPPGERRHQDQCGRQEVSIDAEGLRAGIDDPDHDCHGFSHWLPDPACSLEQVWKFAADKGTPRTALAEIEYFQAAAGPAWRFRTPDGSHDYVVYGDCTQQLNGKDAAGKIP
jgi:hypothetical protein